MAWFLPVASAVLGLGSSLLSASAQKNAGEQASTAQIEAADKGIAESRRQFGEIQTLLAPFVDAGTDAVTGQQDLIGLNGDPAQADAIQNIEQGAEFGELVRQGEEGILQNASATGGLRGGNTQHSLAQFRPQILSSLINQQFNRLGGIAGRGQASAAQQANLGQNTTANINNQFTQQGDASAQDALITGRANANLFGDITKTIGTFANSGAF